MILQVVGAKDGGGRKSGLTKWVKNGASAGTYAAAMCVCVCKLEKALAFRFGCYQCHTICCCGIQQQRIVVIDNANNCANMDHSPKNNDQKEEMLLLVRQQQQAYHCLLLSNMVRYSMNNFLELKFSVHSFHYFPDRVYRALHKYL